jgi:hypothetical protein
MSKTDSASNTTLFLQQARFEVAPRLLLGYTPWGDSCLEIIREVRRPFGPDRELTILRALPTIRSLQ